MDASLILPLTRATFEPGDAEKVVESSHDKDLKNIMQAELYYFKGDAQACNDIVIQYLDYEKEELQLSANILYTFANLALKKIGEAERGVKRICAFSEAHRNKNKEEYAISIFAKNLATILLHLNIEDSFEERDSIVHLPFELRICAAYIVAHRLYLDGDYSQAIGISYSAILFSEKSKPIIMIYLYCMLAVCNMNLKHIDDAKMALLTAWNIAKKDGFIEPFIEHHGLLQGLMEVCIKKEDPSKFKEFSNLANTFGHEWMNIHNSFSENQISNTLSTMEFSIAMLASRNWSNQEISSFLGISLNTVKHYLSTIYEKLNIKKRSELKQFIV